MQLMYTETPCFGENKWIQKITQNTQKYILRRATKVTISNFRGWRRKKKPRFAWFFFGGSHRKKWCAPSIIFCQERWSQARRVSTTTTLLVARARIQTCSRVQFDLLTPPCKPLACPDVVAPVACIHAFCWTGCRHPQKSYQNLRALQAEVHTLGVHPLNRLSLGCWAFLCPLNHPNLTFNHSNLTNWPANLITCPVPNHLINFNCFYYWKQ